MQKRVSFVLLVVFVFVLGLALGISAHSVSAAQAEECPAGTVVSGTSFTAVAVTATPVFTDVPGSPIPTWTATPTPVFTDIPAGGQKVRKSLARNVVQQAGATDENTNNTRLTVGFSFGTFLAGLAALIFTIIYSVRSGGVAKGFADGVHAANTNPALLTAIEYGGKNIPPAIVEKFLAVLSAAQVISDDPDVDKALEEAKKFTKNVTDGEPNEDSGAVG